MQNVKWIRLKKNTQGQNKLRGLIQSGLVSADRSADGLIWLVSDLHAKKSLQRILLNRNQILSGDAVLRIGEFSTKLALLEFPSLRLVSDEVYKAWAAQRLEELSNRFSVVDSDPLQSVELSSQTLMAVIEQLLPVFANASVQLKEELWVDELCEVARLGDRWKHGIHRAYQLWQISNEERFLLKRWSAGLLLSSFAKYDRVESKTIVVDLGLNLNPVELQVLLEIARKRPDIELIFIMPDPVWKKDYSDRKDGLGQFESQFGKNEFRVESLLEEAGSDDLGQDSAQIQFVRYESALGEIKSAVSEVRNWIKQGVEPRSITIACAQLELMWPVLRQHLEQAGLPCAKPTVAHLHSFPDVAAALARLRHKFVELKAEDLEADLFRSGQVPELTFQVFQDIFSAVSSDQDLSLHRSVESLHQRLSQRIDEQLRGAVSSSMLTSSALIVDRNEFLNLSLVLLDKGLAVDRLTALFRRFLELTPAGISLRLKSWVEVLSEIAARTEFEVKNADLDGVQILDVAHLEGLAANHLIVLGLSEEGLKRESALVFDASSASRIETLTGWPIASEDQRLGEVALRWTLENQTDRAVLSFAETDLFGVAQTASWFWLLGDSRAKERGQSDQSGEVGEELIQDQNQGQTQGQTAPMQGLSTLAIDRINRQQGFLIPEKQGEQLVRHLSASTVDQYQNCPLQFYLGRVIAPRDLGQLDLDLDARASGSLIHAVLERLSRACFTKATWKDPSDQEILVWIREARQQIEAGRQGVSIVRSEDAFRIEELKKIKTVRAVIEEERQYRAKNPSVRTVLVEASLRGVVRIDSTRSLAIKGRIDRIDWIEDTDSLVIIDYKSKVERGTLASWLSGGPLQPLIYAWAVRSGFVELPPEFASLEKIAGVCLYDLKKLKRTGLWIKDFLPESSWPKTGGKSIADLESALSETEGRLVQVADSLWRGAYPADPADPKECNSCQWRTACRAPHLELHL